MAEVFGIGHTEIIAVLLVIFILFGRSLPSVMRIFVQRGVNPYESPRRALFVLDVLMVVVVLAAVGA